MIKPLFRNVLIVINGSEGSIHAAQYGILMSKLYRCNLKAVYVVDTATLKQLTLSKFFVADESREYETSLSSDGERYLRYVEELGKSKGIKIETEMRRGSVWTEVIAAASSYKADLILLSGSETHSNDKYDVLTAAYRDILGHAECSVMFVREKTVEQLYKLV